MTDGCPGPASDAEVREADGVCAVVRGGFIEELAWEPGVEPAVVRRTINDALLAWYDRERAAGDALGEALRRAGDLGVPSLIGQVSLPEAPAWVDHVTRLASESLDSRDD